MFATANRTVELFKESAAADPAPDGENQTQDHNDGTIGFVRLLWKVGGVDERESFSLPLDFQFFRHLRFQEPGHDLLMFPDRFFTTPAEIQVCRFQFDCPFKPPCIGLDPAFNAFARFSSRIKRGRHRGKL